MKQLIINKSGKLPDENRTYSHAKLLVNPDKIFRQPAWQRITLLIVLGYEGIGALLGGSLLIIAPDGKLMDMPVDIMHGVFHNFLIPGLILLGLGILITAAFIAVLCRTQFDWLLSSLGLGGLAIWFITEIIILQELHWLHAMWGLPVLVGCLVAFPLVSSHFATRHRLHNI